jgi:hypothetical protein
MMVNVRLNERKQVQTRRDCSRRSLRGWYNCSDVVAIAAARFRRGRCSRNCTYSNKVDFPSDNLTHRGT